MLIILLGVSLWLRRNDVAPPQGTVKVSGHVVCLPHRVTNGPQTLECAIGLQDDNGTYYGLRNMNPPLYDTNISIVVDGNLEPDTNSNYNVVGIIDVSSWKRL